MGIRSFLAIPISAGVKDKFRLILHNLQVIRADVKWVKLENIHLTLKFLGDLEEKRLESVSEALEKCRPRMAPSTSCLRAIGAFPNLRHPKILWGALDDSSEELKTIVDILEGELAKIDMPKEDRPFKPHLTFGRVRSSANLQSLTQAIREISFEDKLRQISDKVILYKSTLTSQGPVYEVLREFILGS
jgi:2'-5' RNA ligase